MRDSSGTSSVIPIFSSIPGTQSGAKRCMMSSPNDTKKRLEPGSPCRPDRPRSWLSMRRDSCRSVPITCRPPAFATPSPSLMSVPRPAMFVAITTAPGSPAFSTMCASRSCCFAFSTSWSMPFRRSSAARYSDFSIEVVPTSTGRPCPCISAISSTTAPNFAFSLM